MKLNKDILAVMVLDYKENLNDELEELKRNFRAFETDLTISCRVRERFTQQLNLFQQKENVEQTNSAWEFQEFLSDDLEDCVLKIFNEYDTPVNPASSKPKARAKKVIIRLSKRKVVFNILQTKKKLKSVDIKSVGLPNVYLIFMNRNLCSYFKYLWSLYFIHLHLKKMMHSFWVSDGNVSLKLRENTPMYW